MTIMQKWRWAGAALAGAVAMASAGIGLAADAPGTAHPGIWPVHHYPVREDAASRARVEQIIARMTLEEKIGQLVQGDICCTTPEDVRRYHLGSVLNGGSSGPGGDDKAPAPAWLKLADAFWQASTDRSGGGVGIPVLWGTDAVHGHSNIIGATLFPHNIALGAAHDPHLVERIGAATATEVRVTGLDWTFAPTVAVPQDYRWGRAYEGYSSDPALVSSLVGAMVRGLQGPGSGRDLLAKGKVLASTKHFLGDGATEGGVDQGNAVIGEAQLRDIHGAPYGPAIDNGVGTVMASFSSWQGRKMTGNAGLLTGVLKDRMGFGGFVVSDWNAHGQVEGCTTAACPQAVLAGIDMVMAPDSWKAMITSLMAETRAGVIPMGRIDDAVRRILLVKERLGLLDAPRPSQRALAGRWELLGSAEHRAIAREAVRKSLVLLKNDGVLPIAARGHLLVAGDGADDISRAAGGWTISWQGTGLSRADFPGATSIWQGLQAAMAAGGGSAELAPDGHFAQRPDAAVVVFGERPYAEFQGDLKSLQLASELTGPWATMRALRAQHIPVVAIMLTGRPLFVNPALNAANGFVVAWLPGSEGAGVADVVIGDARGRPRHAVTGRLPADWPRTARMADGVLYARGSGMRWGERTRGWTMLSEDPGVAPAVDTRRWFGNGQPAKGWTMQVRDGAGGAAEPIVQVPAQALQGRLAVAAADFAVQEGARRFVLRDGAAMVEWVPPAPLDLSREVNGEVEVLMTLRGSVAGGRLLVGSGCGAGACEGQVAVTIPAGERWVRYGLPLKCLVAHGADLTRANPALRLTFAGPGELSIGEVRLGSDHEQELPCPGQ